MRFILFFLFITLRVFALEVPALTSPVMDLASILKADSQIVKLIDDYLINAGVQLQVLTIPSLEGDALETFSINVVEKWKLGGEKTDGGILLLIVKDSKKIRIEVGHGLEGFITDLEAGEIIRGMKPYFRRQRFDAGVVYALQSISQNIGAEPFVDKEKFGRNQTDPGSIFFFIFFIIFMIIFFNSIANRNRNSLNYKKSKNRRRGWGNDDDFFGGSGGGGFGGGSFGGGGGWSGGGGSFGGGGASGGW